MHSWALSITVTCCAMSCAGCAHGYRIQEGVRYAAPGTRPLHLTLFLPEVDDAAARRPCVVLIHGGAWVSGTRHQLRWYGRRLAEEGYVAAAISYRKLPRHRFPACVHDAKSAVRWLRLHADDYRIDPDRIAALGNSAGGHLAAMLAATAEMPEFEGTENPGPPSDISAAVSLYGALDLAEYKQPKTWIRVGGVAKGLVRRFVTTDAKAQRDPYAAASPITYFDANTRPILLIQGEKDNLVSVDVARRAHDMLVEAGVKTNLIIVPDRGHAFDFFYPKIRRELFPEILHLLHETLGAPPRAARCRGTGTSDPALRGGDVPVPDPQAPPHD
ncbi:MAG TPA: alpha/beta hydrolase [Candidatus Hydrogenedentes bacterium]|nr:alpha/beta hydrolase [Candidatus Hydrogenedentota bacterium]